jgi:hypothetical protein
MKRTLHILILLLVTVMTYGCGDSTEDTVFTGSTATPTRLQFLNQPMRAGEPLVTFQVGLYDQFGNLVPLSGVPITLTSAQATLTGDTTEVTVDGIATFDGVVINASGDNYVIRASATGLTGAASGPFSVEPASPDGLAFAQQPNGTGLGIPTNFTVSIQDAFNNPIPGASVTIEVLDANTLNPVAFTGTTSGVTGADGTAAFTDIAVGTLGNYLIRATSDALTADSTPFTVGQIGYMRSTVGEPWAEDDPAANPDAMDAAFGAGQWDPLRFETFNIADLNSYTFIYMDGSDDGTNGLDAFMDANRTALETWVSAGGCLFVNAAPNSGDGTVLCPFNVQILDNNEEENVTAADPTSPIFTGVATNYTGDSFSHAIVTGTGLTPLIVGNPSNDFVLAEAIQSNGFILYGGMTITFFQNPKPDSFNLRVNILQYAAAPHGALATP